MNGDIEMLIGQRFSDQRAHPSKSISLVIDFGTHAPINLRHVVPIKMTGHGSPSTELQQSRRKKQLHTSTTPETAREIEKPSLPQSTTKYGNDGKGDTEATEQREQ